jgi:hypothetical protein
MSYADKYQLELLCISIINLNQNTASTHEENSHYFMLFQNTNIQHTLISEIVTSLNAIFKFFKLKQQLTICLHFKFL